MQPSNIPRFVFQDTFSFALRLQLRLKVLEPIHLLQQLFEYYIAHPESLPVDFQPQLSFDGMERIVCDYIAGMTDNYAVNKFNEIFVPAGWNIRG